MGETNIEWTDRVWNPIRGCSRVSAGCMHCYAEVMAARFARQWGTPEIVRPDGGWSGVLSFVESKLTEPLHWRAPQRVFVNSMSDLFHERVPDELIDRVFAVMALSPQHTFQILTKRPERMREYLAALTVERLEAAANGDLDVEAACYLANWINGWSRPRTLPDDGNPLNGTVRRWPLPNVWLGVSVEDQATADARIPLLLQTPAAVRFCSYEPALGPVGFDDLFYRIEREAGEPASVRGERFLHSRTCEGFCEYGCGGVGIAGGLDWIIVGGESGPGARVTGLGWIRNTVMQCHDAGVAVFVKQVGARVASGGSMPDRPKDRKGGDMEEWPEDLRVREFPAVAGRERGR